MEGDKMASLVEVLIVCAIVTIGVRLIGRIDK